MIREYYRPKTLQEALELLAREGLPVYPLGGGTVLNRPSPEPCAVVDLQELGLDGLEVKGNVLHAGATVTLESLLGVPDLPEALQRAIRHEASYNIRQAATVAGSLAAADGRSPFACALLALDASLEIAQPGSQERVSLGDWLPLRRQQGRGRLITSVNFPLNVRLAYESVSRTPADTPIVCAAAARWRSGRTRLALGGFGDAPRLVLDGPEAAGAEQAARDAYSQAGDEWASAEYRAEMAATLSRRCLQQLSQA